MLVDGGDGNFRPIDLQFAPDGSLYIVDWHNALIGHLQHNLRDPSRDHVHGRIWRVTYPSRPLVEPTKIAGEPVPALLDALKSPEARTRYRARRQLAARPTEEVLPALGDWLENLDPADPLVLRHKLEGLWLTQSHDAMSERLLSELLSADDPRARSAAVKALSFDLDKVGGHLDLLAAAVADDHPRVRAEAVRALSYVSEENADRAAELALSVLERDLDPFLQYTLDETMRALE